MKKITYFQEHILHKCLVSKKLLLFSAFLIITFTQAQVNLVKDINPGSGDGLTNQFVSFNNQLLFSADDNINGFELWISDGSSTGTQLLTNIAASGASSSPQWLYYWSGTNEVYFSASASTGAANFEPYKTDGTVAGTFALANINTSGSSFPSNFTGFSGNVYFTASTFGSNSEVYSTDGTTAGTSLFKEINLNNPSSSNGGSSNPNGYTIFNGKMYFSASNGSGNGSGNQELWFSDGTSANTILLKNINFIESSNPADFTIFNNKLYFTANNRYTLTSTFGQGRELWVTDGTSAGTQLVLDLYPGSADSNPQNLTVYNNALYFTATHPTLGTEIFKMNAAENITSLKNIASGGNSSYPSDFFVFSNVLYFSADDNINGRELWSTTGFSSQTNMLKDINTSPATPDSNPSGFTAYFGEIFFSANNDTNGRELWKTDGTTAGTVLVDDINISGDSNPENLTVAGDNLFFSATTPTTGKELFRYIDTSLSVNKLELENRVSLFPNPTKNSFTIKSNTSITGISILDVQGKMVKQFTERLEVYDIGNLTNGIYFVNIQTDIGTLTKKLIKE